MNDRDKNLQMMNECFQTVSHLAWSNCPDGDVNAMREFSCTMKGAEKAFKEAFEEAGSPNKEFAVFLGRTTDEDLEDVAKMMENADSHDNPFADKIFQAMEDDADGKWTELYHVYMAANAEERAVCDSLLTAVCGWTFHSIIRQVKEDMEEEKEAVDE